MKALFEVRLLVDAKRLGEVLALLDGKAYNVQQRLVRREASVEVTEGESFGQAELLLPVSTTNKLELVKNAIRQLEEAGTKQFRSADIADQLGITRSYISLMMSELVKSKVVKRVRIGVFDIVKHKKATNNEAL